MNYSELCEEVIALSAEAASFIREELKKVTSGDIKTKDHNSLVTYVDQTAERMIVKRLKELLPSASFITEEETVEQTESEQVWIIDPLDGTTNFLQQIPHFAVSIALRVAGQLQIGVVYDVMREQCFHAVKGNGAFCDHSAISVSNSKSLDEFIIATGFPYSNSLNFKALLNILEYWMRNARGIRRFGSAALDLCFVAVGRLDCYYESTLNVWDVAAGILIVEEAGGKLSDYQGGNNFGKGAEVVASNGHMHDEIIEAIKEHGIS